VVNLIGQSSALSQPLLVIPVTATFPNAPLGLTSSGVTSVSFVLDWSMRNDALSRGVTAYVLSVSSTALANTRLEVLTNHSMCILGCSATVVDLRPATTCVSEWHALTRTPAESCTLTAPWQVWRHTEGKELQWRERSKCHARCDDSC
jgi:hypothetical protein